jgi:hypothetical protein
MVARSPGGVFTPSITLAVELDAASNTVIIHVDGAIPAGWLSFALEHISTPIGMAAGEFHISTWDGGVTSERIYDQVVHRLVNPVDLQHWYGGDAHHPAPQITS